jgi:hypothetical protein
VFSLRKVYPPEPIVVLGGDGRIRLKATLHTLRCASDGGWSGGGVLTHTGIPKELWDPAPCLEQPPKLIPDLGRRIIFSLKEMVERS